VRSSQCLKLWTKENHTELLASDILASKRSLGHIILSLSTYVAESELGKWPGKYVAWLYAYIVVDSNNTC